jgi:hypothetical protein
MMNKEAIETLKRNYPDACFEQLREAVDAAIVALKQSELQSRCMLKDLEKEIYDYRVDNIEDDYDKGYNQAVKDVLKSIKRVKAFSCQKQPEPQWILCTDRLPDKECFCLVTVNDGAIYTDLSLFKKDGEFIEHTGDVIAWMPLPEPYQERRTDDEEIH